MKKKYFSIILAAIAGIVIGILANRNREYLINAQFIRNHLHFREKVKDIQRIIQADGTVVFLAFGQSNSANYGNGKYICRNEIYNYYKDDLYLAQEPLLGPDGGGSSVWTRLADIMIDSGFCKRVVIVPIGVGQTSIVKWTTGDCRKILNKTLVNLKQNKINLNYIFWFQGETDNVDGTSKIAYKQSLNQLVDVFRNYGFEAPFYSSITSYFPYNNDHPLGINENITEAQTEIIASRKDVLPGPNTDSLNLAYFRADAVHFTEKGLDTLAKEWFKKIRSTSNDKAY